MFLFYFIELMIVPIIMVACGRLWKNHPPKSINKIYGYRTARSMKSKESWDFAHKYFGRILFRSGLGVAVLTIIILLMFKNSSDSTLGKAVIILLLLQVAALIVPIIPTEMALKRKYEK